MLAQQGDNGNRAHCHRNLPQAALTWVTTRTTAGGGGGPALAEPGAGPLHWCRHANRLRLDQHNPTTGGWGVHGPNPRH